LWARESYHCVCVKSLHYKCDTFIITTHTHNTKWNTANPTYLISYWLNSNKPIKLTNQKKLNFILLVWTSDIFFFEQFRQPDYKTNKLPNKKKCPSLFIKKKKAWHLVTINDDCVRIFLCCHIMPYQCAPRRLVCLSTNSRYFVQLRDV